MPTNAFTIAKLADAAHIGVESVRYYQRRGLLRAPARSGGSFREYAQTDVSRLQFIKRAQDLGFSLDDVEELISLSADPNHQRVRAVTQQRLKEIRQRVVQLQAMEVALQDLVGCCERADSKGACPIIAALADVAES